MPRKKVKINVKKLSPTAKIPTVATGHAAGYDLYADEQIRIAGRGGRVAVKTGLAFEIDPDFYVEIQERSGFSMKTPLIKKAGIIDPDYRGEIKVVLQNDSDFPVDIEKGTKIVQFTVHRRENVNFIEVEEFETEATERGEKGFGSSGD